MKKRTIILVSLLSFTLILEACNLVSHSKGRDTLPPTSSVTDQTPINQESLPSSNSSTLTLEKNYIGETKAMEIALNHSKVETKDLLFSRTTLDIEDQKTVYDVEFYALEKEYDYEIDALTGNILTFDMDMEYDYIAPSQDVPAVTEQASNIAPSQDVPTVTEQVPQGQSVDLETAKQIALSKVAGATADHIRIKEDYDDGRLVYEGKIIYQQMEYDFEIDASTGNILDWEAESIYD